MTSIPKKVLDRFIKVTPKFQKVLKDASNRDVNEADTVTIIADILTEVFGFDRYTEITSEYAIRNTYCDLAVKINNSVKYLIEVKSISIDLKETHLRQAINYGANEGIQWVVLTNGLVWQIYNIRLKQSITSNKLLEFVFLDINPRKKEDQEHLYLLAKEGLSKDVISEYQERVMCVNRYIISSIVLNKFSLDLIRRELKRLSPGLKIENSEIESILKNDIIKRNVIEDDEFNEAQKKVKRSVTKHTK